MPNSIAEIRLSKRISQRKLAQRAELNPATLCRIERGKQVPGRKTLRLIAYALQVKVSALGFGTPHALPHVDSASQGTEKNLQNTP